MGKSVGSNWNHPYKENGIWAVFSFNIPQQQIDDIKTFLIDFDPTLQSKEMTAQIDQMFDSAEVAVGSILSAKTHGSKGSTIYRNKLCCILYPWIDTLTNGDQQKIFPSARGFSILDLKSSFDVLQTQNDDIKEELTERSIN